jgi:cell division protein FtsW
MQQGKVDRPLLIALLILVGFGLLMVFSASMYTTDGGNGLYTFIKQVIFAAAGLVIMYFVSRIDYRRFNSERFAMILIGASVVLLMAVLVIGTKVNDARRWISFAGVTFQPSELAKVAGILYFSGLLVREPEVLNNSKDFFIKCILPIGVLCGLTAVEPSLSAALAIAVGMLMVLFLGGVPKKRIVPYLIAGGAAVLGLLIVEPWRLERIMVTFGKSGADYQITQSILAISTGGLFGKGLGNGIQKYLFLPELENDFIFSNIGEEFGLVGCLLVIALFCYIVWRGIRIANAAPDEFGYLYTCGVMTLIAFQVLVNIGVASGAMPVTGMALPFVSAGGTSIMVLFAMMGPIFNLSRRVKLKRIKR